MLRHLIARLFLWFEMLKGRRNTHAVQMGSSHRFLGSLTGYSVAGFEITIYCEKRQYMRTYDRWQAKEYNLYHVYCVVNQDAPEALRKACDLVLDFPAFLPEFISDEWQKNEAIKAYLDVLTANMIAAKDPFNG